MKVRLSLIWVFLMFFVSGALFAKDILMERSGLFAQTPESWEHTYDASTEALNILSPDELVLIQLEAVTDADQKDVLRAAFLYILDQVPDAQFGEVSTQDLGGMDMRYMVGTGTLEDGQVAVMVGLISALKPVIVRVYMSEKGVHHEKVVDEFFDSISAFH